LPPYVAKIDEDNYASLAEAIAAVLTNGTQLAIAMVADETIDVNTAPSYRCG